jgi:hypothetical protein
MSMFGPHNRQLWTALLLRAQDNQAVQSGGSRALGSAVAATFGDEDGPVGWVIAARGAAGPVA